MSVYGLLVGAGLLFLQPARWAVAIAILVVATAVVPVWIRRI